MLTLSGTLPAPRHALTVLAMLLFSIIAPLAQAADFLLQDTNFESGYTLGQLTTDATGTTAGQGGWFTATTGTGGAANWNVVADPVSGGSHGNVLATQAGNTDSGNNVPPICRDERCSHQHGEQPGIQRRFQNHL